MALTRFARDSIDFAAGLVLQGFAAGLVLQGFAAGLVLQGFDRLFFKSLASRVNAIDPNGLLRHRNTPRPIVNLWSLGIPAKITLGHL